MKLRIGNKKEVKVKDFAEASELYRKFLYDGNYGSRDEPGATIKENDQEITHTISYNGRVWKVDPKATKDNIFYKSSSRVSPVYDPYKN